MRFSRWSVLLSLILAAAACKDAPATAPAGALLGRFGGPGSALVGTASYVHFETVCGTYRFPQVLVPDASGLFALGPILVTLGAGQRGAVALRGTVAGGRLDVEFRVLTGAAGTGSTRFVLTQDTSADYSGVACAA